MRAINGDWATFSSARGITLGAPPSSNALTMQDFVRTFIAMDPSEHTRHRKTVRSVSTPSNLRNIEPLIRERTIAVLDALPEGETFDWVDTVSIELTTLMLAALFDFPLEERRKLTRWSDVVFAIPEPGGVVESIEQKGEELTEMALYFGELCSGRARRRRRAGPRQPDGKRRGHQGHGHPRRRGKPDPADRGRQRHDP
ncbi:cytochrome P450 [Rhabdothermincola sediminis]|uniref:cytochrome P450 n=1 Tax=Rhabdothermincola sediminis TaxID=2751370 RepID=UPI001AA04A3E|nr:cytochrome P450 [Rhabdothermincola sediminis]